MFNILSSEGFQAFPHRADPSWEGSARIWLALSIGSFLGGIIGAATVTFVGDWIGTLGAIAVGMLIGVGVMIWVRMAE